MQLGEKGWAETLKIVDATPYNLSLGLHDGERLQAYILAWPRETLAVNRKEPVIVINDLAVAPEGKTYFFPLLRALSEEAQRKKLAHLPVEGVSTEQAYPFYEKHMAAFLRLGYRKAGTYAYFDEKLKRRMVWIRCEPAT